MKDEGHRMKDKIDSTLKLIDEGNKSFIFHPLSFILYLLSFILYLLSSQTIPNFGDLRIQKMFLPCKFQKKVVLLQRKDTLMRDFIL